MTRYVYVPTEAPRPLTAEEARAVREEFERREAEWQRWQIRDAMRARQARYATLGAVLGLTIGGLLILLVAVLKAAS